jgi:uncharacterized Zn finger protein
MGYFDHGYGGYPPYVPVAERRLKAQKEAEKLRKRGQAVSPVHIEGRKIASTYWGKAWCDNLEAYSDYANRLPRGRTYVRNGSVMDLQIVAGKVTALVSGSHIYKIEVKIEPVQKDHWQSLVGECAGQIDSLVELLRGKLSAGVMAVISRRDKGLFPTPRQIRLSCSCPDSASMCKHVAATLYGVGARLDHKPELLFLLRGVDHMDLITQAGQGPGLGHGAGQRSKALADTDLESLFGIDIGDGHGDGPAKQALPKQAAPAKQAPAKQAPAKQAAPAKPTARKPARQPPRVQTHWTRQDLLAAGVSSSQIASLLRTGLLTHTEERACYRASAAGSRRIAELTSG